MEVNDIGSRAWYARWAARLTDEILADLLRGQVQLMDYERKAVCDEAAMRVQESR